MAGRGIDVIVPRSLILHNLEMGKKVGNKDRPASNPSIQQGQSMTLREENSGKKDASVSSILRIQHLQKLAKWAGGEAGVPPLGALFGYRLAANAEAAGVPLDSSCFLCQRCETMLQPGFNCTIRIEKNVKNKGRRNKSVSTSKNNMVYTCHFCSYRNVKWGTPTDHVKGLLASRPKANSSKNRQHSAGHNKALVTKTAWDQKPQEKTSAVLDPNSELKSMTPKKVGANMENMPVDEKTADSVPPLEKSLSASKKKRKASKSHQSELSSSVGIDSGKGTGDSTKRRRKSWSSLKEISESNDLQKTRNLSNIVIPFHL
ncbi:hypothetical protein J5N97_028917 [Dioscorea zingiberensis]|uniref:Uncharacterized protein n=1 Tax=Dioscorea zingiberensis TaxID=325984 RepID=A0A9D5H5F0_9LILI|nr:hypothetical protein J5N97_028917 [Dioscorea zingiberensis]